MKSARSGAFSSRASRPVGCLRTSLVIALAAFAFGCGTPESGVASGGGGNASATDAATAATSSVAGAGGSVGAVTGSGGNAPEVQPTPASGAGIADPPTNSLHDHLCGGTDWQRIHGWLLLPHAAPEVAPQDEMALCMSRYAGWVTNLADAASVSRASVYAALAATGQCDASSDYDGAMISGELCASVHPDLDPMTCSSQMAAEKSFGISTVAAVIAKNASKHDGDVPLMAALLGHDSIACGGADRWKLMSPAGFIDHYVAAYNAYHRTGAALPQCSKRLVVTVALYSGIGDPGALGVAAANGCWTYERVEKSASEWKICGYDGSVHHPDGVKWAYDDTSTEHTSSTELSHIHDCMNGVPGRGYIYMTNRGDGWPSRVTTGVHAHFAELYSSQFTVDDQLTAWVADGKPGQPMVNFGEPTTGQSTIHDVTASVCGKVQNGGYFGVYVYPEALTDDRLSAMVQALNACTE